VQRDPAHRVRQIDIRMFGQIRSIYAEKRRFGE
jgi:hypothetical protein